MIKSIRLNNLSETQAFAQQLAQRCSAPCLLFFRGDLGAGKTTLIQHLLQAIGVTGLIKSPSYTIVEPYTVGDLAIYHMDFYRITDSGDMASLGLDDYWARDAIILVEWPQNAGEWLPAPDVILDIDIISSEARTVRLAAKTQRGERLINEIPAS